MLLSDAIKSLFSSVIIVNTVVKHYLNINYDQLRKTTCLFFILKSNNNCNPVKHQLNLYLGIEVYRTSML